jgi:hypothetical protein
MVGPEQDLAQEPQGGERPGAVRRDRLPRQGNRWLLLGGAAFLASALSLHLTGLFVFLMLWGNRSLSLGPVVVAPPLLQILLRWFYFWSRRPAVMGMVLGLVALALVWRDVRRGLPGARKARRLAVAATLLGVGLLLLWHGIEWLFCGR